MNNPGELFKQMSISPQAREEFNNSCKKSRKAISEGDSVEARVHFLQASTLAYSTLRHLASQALQPIESDEDVHEKALYVHAHTEAEPYYLDGLVELAHVIGSFPETMPFIPPRIIARNGKLICDAYAQAADAYCVKTYGKVPHLRAKAIVLEHFSGDPKRLIDRVHVNNLLWAEATLRIAELARQTSETISEYLKKIEEKEI